MTIDKTLFRQTVGTFGTGVTVITTGSEGNFHGMTANAFSSVSLDPTLILVCVDKSAETLPVLSAAQSFNVNILAAEQEQLSRTFASKDSPQAHGLQDVDYRLGDNGLPLLNGTVAFLECRVVQTHDSGDHYIFVGEVDRAEFVDGLEPLMFFRGRYRALSELSL